MVVRLYRLQEPRKLLESRAKVPAFYRLLQILSLTLTKCSTRQSQRSNRSGSHMSSSSSLSITRAKEAARIAELKAEAAASNLVGITLISLSSG